ncbi:MULTISPECIES: EAL domain-containing protein [unclassified Chromobacterium]|uniref:EAL domain-containing protein n=1 Tax=unclassified Chromobacterium TaxID=2641838 RepID=UPI000652A3F7|nr:EAL domain-containing protein [Chromobacterium sp. LK1]KMN32316.1 diguanylate phosphodiesterase [Chromobacterium sp. LK1]
MPTHQDHSPVSVPANAMPIEEIWRALVNDQLIPWFQPIVDIASRKVIAAEALARWQHPALGVLSPVSFVPAMEERGMIRELTELILEKSLYACSDWQERGHDIPVSINLTSMSLEDDSLCDQLLQKVRILGLEPAKLTLEFSESTLRQHWLKADAKLAQLRAAGFGTGIDEFGIGVTLTDKLLSSHFSMLKVDRAFVQGVNTNQHLQAILREDFGLAKAAGLTTVAIGVEDSADLATLTELGCDAVQGYICSAPCAAAEFLQWISEWEKG